MVSFMAKRTFICNILKNFEGRSWNSTLHIKQKWCHHIKPGCSQMFIRAYVERHMRNIDVSGCGLCSYLNLCSLFRLFLQELPTIYVAVKHAIMNKWKCTRMCICVERVNSDSGVSSLRKNDVAGRMTCGWLMAVLPKIVILCLHLNRHRVLDHCLTAVQTLESAHVSLCGLWPIWRRERRWLWHFMTDPRTKQRWLRGAE